ncbi:MAG: hypothetical protein B6241_02355 [Spirochaetaceae bacterium 4572_59]|nr:MAG: hypothetical protein B6241_02355 [Spirochaetaceae bacterium 4572_59]
MKRLKVYLSPAEENEILVGELPEGFEHWIIKFSGPDDLHDSGSVEYAYSLMARDCGIVMPETRVLIENIISGSIHIHWGILSIQILEFLL